MKNRASGVLMHISSLPGRFGIGTFGKEAFAFVDFLSETHQTYWQILPLTTTSFGDSPYQSFSAIAGNTHFIDFDLLTKEGLLQESDYKSICFSDQKDEVDYARIFKLRRPILEKAVKNLLASNYHKNKFLIFEEENEHWLNDFADFMAIKEFFGNKALHEWKDKNILNRDAAALKTYRQKLSSQILYHKVSQYLFFKQWLDLKTYANQKHIQIIGDMPIYVSADSVEMWVSPELFQVDKSNRPLYVAGVPADEFSEVGQYWGNPLYNWKKHEENHFSWWVQRIRESFKIYDVLRIDHFKAFSDYWRIDASEDTAVNGSWQSGPGYALFKQIKLELGNLPIIAENLGYVDKRAQELLADCGFPGMNILEFGFFDVTGASRDLPHYYLENSVSYTGTHDNEVINSWYMNLSQEQRDYCDSYTNRKYGQPITQAMLQTLYASVSRIAIATMQDLLDKGGDSRMNEPNTVGHNWKWRMKTEDLSKDKREFLAEITKRYDRMNKKS